MMNSVKSEYPPRSGWFAECGPLEGGVNSNNHRDND